MRRYGMWAGRPNGAPEMPERCVVEVSRGWLFYQCSKKRGKGVRGDLCTQHAKYEAEGRYLSIPKEES